MYDYSINQGDQYYKPQYQNEPYVEQPAPQPYIPPEAQILTQPYTQPVNQQILVQNVIQPVTQQTPQTTQPYIVQVNPQQYVSQPCYFTQPGVGVDSKELKSKLFCPKVFIWVVFVLEIIYIILSFITGASLSIFSIISCVSLLIVAILFNKSVENMKVKTYNVALIIYALDSIFLILDIISLFHSSYSLRSIYYFLLKISEIILLFVLIYYRKEFNIHEMPTNKEMAIPPVVL